MTHNSEAVIDLSYAKSAYEAKTVAKRLEAVSQDLINRCTELVCRNGVHVTEDVVAQAMKLLSGVIEVIPYVHQATKSNVLESSPEGIFTAENLGWGHEVADQPDFGSWPNADAARWRTGTVSFISHQLLTIRTPEVHNAIHGIESLFWVVIWICLTQCGGGHRWMDSGKGNLTLAKRLFHANELIINVEKGVHFGKDGDEVLENLLERTHKYFEPLHEMLRRWRKVLTLGYYYEAYEFYFIHDYLLEIIRDTILKFQGEVTDVTQDSETIQKPDLLRPEESAEGLVSKETKVVLVDLDHVRCTDQAEIMVKRVPAQDQMEEDAKHLYSRAYNVDKTAAAQAMNLVTNIGELASYAHDATKSNVLNSSAEGYFTAGGLGWNRAVRKQPPDFESPGDAA